MGYKLLEQQLRVIQQLTANALDSVELLWMKDHVQVVIWDKAGNYEQYKVDEDGNTT